MTPDLDVEGLNTIIKGPDFPTAGLILGRSGIRSAYMTGRGSVMMRGRVTTENRAQGARGPDYSCYTLSGEQGQHD
jgi:DNA gyrase subunit A